MSTSNLPHCPRFVGCYWKARQDGELLVGELPISSIVRQHGTPVFIYDRAIVERKFAMLRDFLPSRVSISYSVKANPNLAFLRLFLEKGVGLEIASAGEFYQARTAGCESTNIVFAGPGKTESELETVIEDGIGEIHAESALELERIAAISQRREKITPVLVRVNPNDDEQGGAIRMGGKPAPFGVDEEQLHDLLCYIVNSPYLQFKGIHLFVGTQILDHHFLLGQYRKGFEIAKHAAQLLEQPIQSLDFGGGLGVPYFPGDTELDLNQAREYFAEMLTEFGDEPCFSRTRFMVEPGRFLVAESGIYVTRITDIKMSRGRKFLILDGGMNHHLAASGNLGQVIKRNFPIAILDKLDVPATETVDIVGPLCTPLDTLGRSVQLPKPEVGDLIGVFQSGAYARSASPLAFLSHATPPEILVDNGRAFLIRRRGNFEDHVRDVRNFDDLAESLVLEKARH